MYETIDKISALFGVAGESLDLEFKSGRAYADMTKQEQRREFVKDVTGFANAGGGTLIIGVVQQNGLASHFEPVSMESRLSVDQLTSIIRANTDPVFRGFEIHEIQHVDGRVFVIEIMQGHTAHQNRFDRAYYQRIGATVDKMYDFAIRDVMNRRTHPIVEAHVAIRRSDTNGTRYYYIRPYLKNEGAVTARQWLLHLDVPYGVECGRIHAGIPMRKMDSAIKRSKFLFNRIEYNSAGTGSYPQSGQLMPGQEIVLDNRNAFASLHLKIDSETARYYQDEKPAIHWTLYTDDAPPQHHSYDFNTWFSREEGDDLNWSTTE
ncbi:ATP-binding protein [Burkholderia sp. AU45274]|uniref:AlbA family DNA-binding domain-containing protein n=1 Tax=Burkholderia sp. AU45274 TaxID=3059205 RepID=UPI00264CA3DD|nr:ATP-binding protein [Burkholderia sp. AU45274]MDN7486482.1 ATP-binding protein [Burkholderia sp. AU45274]